MAKNSLIALLQEKLDAARRELRSAAVDFEVSDEQLLDLRASARQLLLELKEQDRRAAQKGLLAALKFW
ncbi:hypothetical protein [Methylosinus sporium]|uniref:Uncharacterized protein n=1 Tax=Methylosinus sporium TaxID=428 RepID=A0A2U1SRT2_METSR|nr:hypothetical protein [Methylosinus sporium]PWB94315.1 hypothetical protein C5689_08305 [Methylosinus sporium]